MTVRELIKILKGWPDKDTEVLVSSDAEGNSFHSLDEVAQARMDDRGELLCSSDDDDDDGQKVLIIYPV